MITIPENLQKTSDLLRRIGKSSEVEAGLLAAVTEQRETHEPIRVLKKAAGVEDDSVERLLLWHAAQRNLPKVDVLPVAAGVRRLLGKELRALPSQNVTYEAGSYMFTWAVAWPRFHGFPRV